MLNRQITEYVKGVAILLMLGLHFFAYPERFNYTLPDWFGSPLTKSMQICVPIYLFLSGFGLYKVSEKKIFNYQECLKRTIKLYKLYWKVFLIFIPIGFILKVYSFNMMELLMNFTALIHTYNGEWWFFALYIELLWLFPLLQNIFKRSSTYIIFIIILLVTTRIILMFPFWKSTANIIVYHLNTILINIPIFVTGIFFAKFSIFDNITKFLPKHQLLNLSLAIILFIIPLLSRAYLPMIGITENVFVPMFILSIILFKRIKIQKTNKFLSILGNNSTNMWLIHSFFCYYLFQSLILYPRNPILIYLWLVLISLLTSILLNKFWNIANNLFSDIKNYRKM